MMRLFPFVLVVLLGWSNPCRAASYGVARSATPVLNTPAFGAIFGGSDGRTLKTDRCGQVRHLEFIALPGTVFRLGERITTPAAAVYRVQTDDYPTPDGRPLYVDSRFIQLREEQPPPRSRSLPPRGQVVAALREAIGSPYVWGGNVRDGVNALIGTFYPAGEAFDDRTERRITLAGLDCSGLLYQAAGGWTPRNTWQLVSYGTGMAVEGKSAQEIAELLQPLDLIVWNGHVVIVLDRSTVIESRLVCDGLTHGGVVTTPLLRRLTEIMRTRRPLDAWPAGGKRRGGFVVRRWLPSVPP